jgi:tetratricopeptide (TPR) repeat protein
MLQENPSFSSEIPTVEKYLLQIQELQRSKDYKKAFCVGKQALKHHPRCADLLFCHVETSVLAKNWSSAIERLKEILKLDLEGPRREQAVLRLSDIYFGFGQSEEAYACISHELRNQSSSLILRKAQAEVAMLRSGGMKDLDVWRNLFSSIEKNELDEGEAVDGIAKSILAMRFAGHSDEASLLLEKHFRPDFWKKCMPDGYGKLCVFNNGVSKIEFYSRLFDPETMRLTHGERQLVLTFDVMEQTWHKEPYGYRPMSQRGSDLLSLRKRTTDDFHQDLSLHDYLQIAEELSKRYPDVVAMGQSLGGYCALYYGSRVEGCRILSTAPRNPLNPKYSGRKYSSYKDFRHPYDMPVISKSSPVIVYDSKNEEDFRYVNESLAKSFPHATLVCYPYCGHSITRYLRDVGILKSSVMDFCDGRPFPVFDAELRRKSSEYLRNLSKLNYTRGRVRTAHLLASRALELGMDVERSKELLNKIEKRLAIENEGQDIRQLSRKPIGLEP